MKPIHLVVTLALLGAGIISGRVFADEQYPEGPEAGKALAQDLISRVPVEDANWKGSLKIFRKNQPTLVIPVSCETIAPTNSNGEWSVSYQAVLESNVVEKLVVIFHGSNAPTYRYVKGFPNVPVGGSPQILHGAEADIPFAGSDFWLSDLGYEFFHWPNQVRLKGQMRRGRPCYVMKSTLEATVKGVYAKVITWVEKESGAPMEAEAYGADGKLVKDFELGSVTKVNGHYQVKNLKMYDRRKGSHTFLEFDLEGK